MREGVNLRLKTPSLTVGLLPRIVFFFFFRFFYPIHRQIAVLEDYVTNLLKLRRIARYVVSPNVIILFGDVLPFRFLFVFQIPEAVRRGGVNFDLKHLKTPFRKKIRREPTSFDRSVCPEMRVRTMLRRLHFLFALRFDNWQYAHIRRYYGKRARQAR